MLDARKLRVLRAVAEHGSFAAAAADLRYTPSAISQQIAALEREAGAVLVERGPRGTRLTQAGAVLDRHAALVLGQLAAARAELDDLQRLRGGSVRVAAFESAWTALVPAAMSRYRADHPGVELHLAEEDPVEAVAAVRAGACDVAVVFEPNALADADLAGLERTVVAHDPLWAVLPAGHPLAGADAVELAALSADPWVAPTAFCAGVVRGACARAGFEPDVVFSSADYGAVQGFVAAGAGVALVPFLALAPREGAVVRPLADGAPTRVLSAITAQDGPRPASATAMVQTLRATAEALLPARAGAQSYV